MSHAFVMVPRRAALLVCATCKPVVLGMLADSLPPSDGQRDPASICLAFPATVPPGDVAECHLCGALLGDAADMIGPPANILPC